MAAHKPLFNILSRHFCTKSKLPRLSNIRFMYRLRFFQEAQKALIDYLHTTRSLPYTYAEHIALNSLSATANLTRAARFPAPRFARALAKFLRYNPINEFEFFFESIGLGHDEIALFLPRGKFFFSEDPSVLDAACALSGFGFPWVKLGVLFREERAIFCTGSSLLESRLEGFKRFGFNTVSVVGVCLAFPCVLAAGEADSALLLRCLRKDLSGFFMGDSGIEDNDVDFCYRICKKFRLLYDLGLEKGEIGALMSEKRSVFVEFSEEIMAQRVEFFCGFDVKKEDVGLLIVHNPEVLNLDLRKTISVVGLLKHVGLGTDELSNVIDKYSHVLGRNQMANLPNVMRALDLNKWFFYEIMKDYQLLATYCLNSPDEDVDEDFGKGLEKIQLSLISTHTMNKLKFLHRIGYGENSLTMKVLSSLQGSEQLLQERFDCLLRLGIEFSQLCSMIRTSPKIMNQKPEILEKKVNFLCQEIGSSLQYLGNFPAYLCFDLEKRMKPRFKFHMWLKKKGLCSIDYSIASILATSEKQFVARIYTLHPAALKHWFESFSCRTFSHS